MDEEAREIRELERKILGVEKTIQIEVSSIKINVEAIKYDMQKLVTRERFEPVAYIAYGLAAGVMTTALGAVLSTVFLK
jgi:hypothetical protein